MQNCDECSDTGEILDDNLCVPVTIVSKQYHAVLRRCDKKWKRESSDLKILSSASFKLKLLKASLLEESTIPEVDFDFLPFESALRRLEVRRRKSGKRRTGVNPRARRELPTISQDREDSTPAELFFSPPPRTLNGRSRRPPIVPTSETRRNGDDDDDDGLPAIPVSMSPDPDHYDHF